MRHPQDNLLIVYALVELARDNRGTLTESHALNLVSTIAEKHGLTAAEGIRQLEQRT